MNRGGCFSSDGEAHSSKSSIARCADGRRRTRHPTNSGSTHSSSLENTPTKTPPMLEKPKRRRGRPPGVMSASNGRFRLRQAEGSQTPEMSSSRSPTLLAARNRTATGRISLTSQLTKNRVNKAIRQSLPGRPGRPPLRRNVSPDELIRQPPRLSAKRSSPTLLPQQKCNVQNCDSRGHLSGRLPFHSSPATCPLFHNVSADECVRLAEERIELMMYGTVNTALEEAAGSVSKRLRLSTVSKSPERKFSHAGVKRLKYLRKQSAANAAADPKKAFNKDKEDTSGELVTSPISQNSQIAIKQPSLDGLNVLPCDRELFLHSQAACVEDVRFEQAVNRAIFPPAPHEPPAEETKSSKAGEKPKNPNYHLKYVVIAGNRIGSWYPSPYPDEYIALDTLYICEFCFRYFRTEAIYRRHLCKCVWRHPPGDEIYRKDDHSIFEVDGYLLSRLEGRIGSPERPLSDLGLLSYRSYWKEIITTYIGARMAESTISIKDISDETGIHRNDIVSTLQVMGILKNWKSRKIILKRTELTKELTRQHKKLKSSQKQKELVRPFDDGIPPRKPMNWRVDASCLRWQPRNRKQNFVPTVAP